MEENKMITVKCECGCSLLKIEKFDDDLFFLSHYYSSFYNKQAPIFNRMTEKIKMVWFIITGRDYVLYEIALGRENTIKLQKMINESLEEKSGR